MTREEAIETLKENLCSMCAYGSQNMESCDIRSCDNRDAIKALEQEQRIFLATMGREEKVCKEVCDDGDGIDLVAVCHSIKRKVKKALWG